MAFTISDFEDLERLLAEHPEWRVRLRPLILGEELLRLPERMSAVESRLDRIEAILERMAARQDGLDERMTQLDERMAQLGERVTALTEQMTELTRIATQHELRLNRMDGRMGNIEGDLLEARYHRHVRDWLGRYLVRAEVVFVDDLTQLEAALQSGDVAAAEVNRLRYADLLVRGRSREDQSVEALFVVEVSNTINTDDIQRAHEHALTLRRAGYNARALVGGYRLAEGIEYKAEELGVLIDLRRAAA